MMELLNRVHRIPVASVRVAPDPTFRARATPLRPVEAPTPRWRNSLRLIERHMSFKRRSLHAGDPVQTAGDTFGCLHLVNFGAIKTMVVTACGFQQVTGLHLKGDWVGFDGIATGYSACDGCAMDTSEIWTVGYAALLKTTERAPELMHVLYTAMATLPVDARLADFLHSWVQALAPRGLCSDNIALCLTRAEIGNYMGTPARYWRNGSTNAG